MVAPVPVRRGPFTMTNRLALILAAILLALLALDYVVFDLKNAIFLARKFADLTEYIAFWR